MKSDIFHGQMEESREMIWFLTKYFMPVDTASYFMLNWGNIEQKDQNINVFTSRKIGKFKLLDLIMLGHVFVYLVSLSFNIIFFTLLCWALRLLLKKIGILHSNRNLWPFFVHIEPNIGPLSKRMGIKFRILWFKTA